MSYKETDIKHEAGKYWVLDTKRDYSVMVTGSTHSVTDSAYSRDNDGLSLAIARANYLNKRSTTMKG